jgi:hypothetical protein
VKQLLEDVCGDPQPRIFALKRVVDRSATVRNLSRIVSVIIAALCLCHLYSSFAPIDYSSLFPDCRSHTPHVNRSARANAAAEEPLFSDQADG